MKKIAWPESKIVQEEEAVRTNTMGENNTLGMIVYRIASRPAIDLANANNIRLVKLSEVGIDYDKLKESCQE